MRRKPGPRLRTARRSDNDKRELVIELPPLRDREALAARASYEPHAKHKYRPRAFGLEPPETVSEDATYCDGHAAFRPEDVDRIPNLLRRGIISGLISTQLAQGDPKVIWTVDNNGWVYEARITIPGQAIYHGYPLLPGDAMATKVINRFSRWVYSENAERPVVDPLARQALAAAQERYRQ